MSERCQKQTSGYSITSSAGDFYHVIALYRLSGSGK